VKPLKAQRGLCGRNRHLILGSNPSEQTQEGIYDSQPGLQAICPVEELLKRTSDHSLEREKKEGFAGEVAISKCCKTLPSLLHLYLSFRRANTKQLAHTQVHVTKKEGLCGRKGH
jgi:hypothetical protein